ncbi:MAG: YqeG family HAD IIIA-type phosphatase, partial [Armatimonadetes bacterium]|nr:YqeG family HAD IIIA-type phosphatase [Armatimonadota bacterium]
MGSLLRPTRLAEAVWDVDLDWLVGRGIRGLVLDLDNTLVEWEGTRVRPEVRAWLDAARARGLGLCLASNAMRSGRVGRMARELGLIPVAHAGKPLPAAFRRAMAALGTPASATCMIGDQLFTDVLGANCLGITTVLVTPLRRRESVHTRLIRLIERPMRRRWARQQAREDLCAAGQQASGTRDGDAGEAAKKLNEGG